MAMEIAGNQDGDVAVEKDRGSLIRLLRMLLLQYVHFNPGTHVLQRNYDRKTLNLRADGPMACVPGHAHVCIINPL
jgi:hypothetical protein